MPRTIIIEGTWEVSPGLFWKPAVDPMSQDHTRMAVRIGDDISLLYQNHRFNKFELIHHDLPISLMIKPIKQFNNDALQEWLANNYERGAYRETLAHKATTIERCPECDHGGVYYMPFRRTNTDFARNPLELHYAVCSKCNWFKRLT